MCMRRQGQGELLLFYPELLLCDLGASINLMSLSIFRRLGLSEARPTTVTL